MDFEDMKRVEKHVVGERPIDKDGVGALRQTVRDLSAAVADKGDKSAIEEINKRLDRLAERIDALEAKKA